MCVYKYLLEPLQFFWVNTRKWNLPDPVVILHVVFDCLPPWPRHSTSPPTVHEFPCLPTLDTLAGPGFVDNGHPHGCEGEVVGEAKACGASPHLSTLAAGMMGPSKLRH